MKICRVMMTLFLCCLLLTSIITDSLAAAKAAAMELNYEKTGITIDDTFISDPAVGVEYKGKGWLLLVEQTAESGAFRYIIYLNNYNGGAVSVQSAVADVNLSIVADGDCSITAPGNYGILFEYWPTAEYDALYSQYQAKLAEYEIKLDEYQSMSARYAEMTAVYTAAYAEYAEIYQEYNAGRNSYEQARIQVSVTQENITKAQTVITLLDNKQNGSLSSEESDFILQFFKSNCPGVYESIMGSTTGGLAAELASYARSILQQYQADLIVQEAQLATIESQLNTMQSALSAASITATSAKQQCDDALIELTNAYDRLMKFVDEMSKLKHQLDEAEFKQSVSENSPIECHIYLCSGATLKFNGAQGKSTNAPQACLFILPGTTVQQLLSQMNCKSGTVLNTDGTPVDKQLPATGMTVTLADNMVYKIVSIADVDGNADVTSADARLALRAAVALENYSEDSAEYKAADVNCDAVITAADARLILRTAVGMEEVKNLMH